MHIFRFLIFWSSCFLFDKYLWITARLSICRLCSGLRCFFVGESFPLFLDTDSSLVGSTCSLIRLTGDTSLCSFVILLEICGVDLSPAFVKNKYMYISLSVQFAKVRSTIWYWRCEYHTCCEHHRKKNFSPVKPTEIKWGHYQFLFLLIRIVILIIKLAVWNCVRSHIKLQIHVNIVLRSRTSPLKQH